MRRRAWMATIELPAVSTADASCDESSASVLELLPDLDDDIFKPDRRGLHSVWLLRRHITIGQMGEAILQVAGGRHPRCGQQQQHYHDAIGNGRAPIESLHLRGYTLPSSFIRGSGE